MRIVDEISGGVTITDVQLPSSSINRVLRYRAVVPELKRGERTAVIYFLHGANSGPDEVTKRSKIVKLAVEHKMIVIIPNGEFSYYTNAKHKHYERWEDVVVKELTADVANRFPVLLGREHTGIAGVSMGGYGAIKIALKHPDKFGFCGSLSGALDITRRPMSVKRLGQSWRIATIFGARPTTRVDEDVFALLARTQASASTVWFIGYADDEPLRSVNIKFAEQLTSRGLHPQLANSDGGHDWGCWNQLLPKLFEAAKCLQQNDGRKT